MFDAFFSVTQKQKVLYFESLFRKNLCKKWNRYMEDIFVAFVKDNATMS